MLRIIAFALGVVIAICPSLVRGAEVTELASSFDEGDPFDFNLKVAYQRAHRWSSIKRELGGAAPDAIALVKELSFSRAEDILSVRAETAVWRDLQLHIELPIVLSQQRNFSFAQNGGSACGTPPETNCVTKNNSTLVRDGLLDGTKMTDGQIAVADSSGTPGGRLLPQRSGLDQLFAGIAWAPMNQTRDSSKPTWALGFEARIAIGNVMKYDPTDPLANTAVGQGLHQFHFWTTVSRRYTYLDPWVNFYYLYPLATSNSLFTTTKFKGSGQKFSGPQHRGGVQVGLEIVPWERPEKNYKVTIELRGQFEGVFDGRGYSSMWELFANNPRLQGPCTPPTSKDNTNIIPWANGTYCSSGTDTIPYPGITSIGSHLIIGGTLAVNVALTEFFKGRLGFNLGHEQEHMITVANAGWDRDGSDKIDENTTELNPLYRPMIDAPDRRFKVDNTVLFDFFVSVMALF
ncbi:MAG: hypothetical protein V1754_04795 [Pseudomonadota bacterium]